jgi:Zn-dependent metalloprotease
MFRSRWLLQVTSVLAVLTILFSSFSMQPALAQGKDGLKRQVNPQTGKVSFLGPENGSALPASQSLGLGISPFSPPADPALALAKRFGSEFGLRSPERELSHMKTHRSENGRITARYQQTYQGIPVLGGELIVNTNDNGDLYSMNGEVSPDLSLSIRPTVDSETAKQTAQQAVAKWNQKTTDDFQTTEPELWIFDESLLQPGTRPAELVWRMDVTPKEIGMPVRELVLVNAQRGSISLHFNQVDGAWTSTASQIQTQKDLNYSDHIALQTGSWPVYFDLVLDESRGWIYGSDSAGNKVDVISMTTLQLVKSFLLVNGAAPKGIALSPTGNELAIAQFGAASILFLNPNNGQTVATLTPNVDPFYPNRPWDVIYGRSGRLYSSGNPDSSGLDFIHVINTTTHTEISKSSYVIRATPYLAISSDKNTLWANETFSPNKLYKFDITTDTIPNPTNTAHTSGFSASTFILDTADNQVFTDTGQVWTSDLKSKIGSTGQMGKVAYVPTRNAIAVTAENTGVVFINTGDFYPLSTYPLQVSMGSLVAQSNGNKLYVSTSNGIVAIDLSAFPPGTPATLPSGAKPYSDLVLDETHNVLYGSNTTGHKIDIISASTLQVIDQIRFNNGASPMGMDINANGSELAVALNGASSLAFINTNTRTISATVVPNLNDYNAPFDVKYGRTGRLYSSGNPDSSGIDYLHVFDTTTHSEVGISTYPNTLRSNPYLAVSADKNYIYANENFIPNALYKFDVHTDTIPNRTQIPWGFSGSMYLLSKSGSKIFTSAGQVWSNPSDFTTSSQIGSFNAQGYLAEIQSQNLVAVLNNPGLIRFVKSTDYSILSALSIPSTSAVGPSIVNANETKLFVNTSDGIKVVNLDPALPTELSIVNGSNQSTPPQTQFLLPLTLRVQNYLGQPLAGVAVTFTAPISGASGTFANTHTNVSTSVTDSNGIATSASFAANSITGGYVVTATVPGLVSTANFQLFNGLQKVKTYTANNSFNLPGAFLCDQTQLNCTNGSNPHADAAHKYAIGTYYLYAVQYGRDSIDNHGMTIVSSVHYCTSNGCPYSNANWNGEQMVYGDAYGYPLADDVVAHELTHGVTQYESNLFYYYQSGAINESFSDLWGEYYDQTNGLGNDTSGVKWQMGEDVSGMGALRNMSNPPAFGDPDKMSSPNYYEGEEDNGGVHFNSGVNNKAVYLMVDGSTFNGKTVSPLGWDKTAAIYYEANTNLLSSGADYWDLYYALQQACTNLIGQKGITAGDCAEVKDAVDAVEMNGQPAPNFNTDASFCDVGSPVTTILSDDLEAGTGNWAFINGAYPRWQVDSPDFGPYAQSGLHSLYVDDYPDVVTDASARLKSFLVQSNTYLRFAQAYDFESGYLIGNPTLYNFDGGVLEYSTNNGATWVDAGSLIDVNGYKGTVATGWKNPLAARSAFVGTSHGYITTRLNLSTLVGQTISFRWRMGLDSIGYSAGWWVDNIQVYTCPIVLGKDTTGVFRPVNGLLYLKNSNSSGFADAALNYGLPGDYPVVGDWDGNGTVTIGIYRNGTFFLRNSNTLGFAEVVFPFGNPGDQPIAGDWDGDGVDTIGVFHPSNGHFFLRNSNTEGPSEMDFYLGNPGDVGVAGDWNGDGMDTTGVFRPSNGVIFLKDKNESGFADYALNYGLPGDRPVMGDWDNNGTDTIGIYRNGSFYLRNSNTNGFAEIIFGLGNPGDMPIAGNWDNLP